MLIFNGNPVNHKICQIAIRRPAIWFLSKGPPAVCPCQAKPQASFAKWAMMGVSWSRASTQSPANMKPEILVRRQLDLWTLYSRLSPYWPPNSNLANLVIYGVFIRKSTFCHVSGHPKQYILVDTIFNYTEVSFWTSRKVPLKSPGNIPFCHRLCWRPKGVFWGLKDIFWSPKWNL